MKNTTKNKKKTYRVRDVIAHLHTLPQDMECALEIGSIKKPEHLGLSDMGIEEVAGVRKVVIRAHN